MRVFLVPGASKISVNVHVKTTGGGRLIDETLLSGTREVAADSFNCLFMKVSLPMTDR